MSKLILLSIIIATIALPARAANIAHPRKGLRKVILWMIYLELFYAFALQFLFGRM